MCARIWQNSAGQPGRRISWYNMQKRIYQGNYARTQSQTRSSRRIHDGLVQDRNFGLDTDNDQNESSIHASPYYTNGRWMGERTKSQRANVSSREGSVRLAGREELVNDFTEDQIMTWLELAQGKTIKFRVPVEDKKIVGMTLTVKNTQKSLGFLRAYISDEDPADEIEAQLSYRVADGPKPTICAECLYDPACDENSSAPRKESEVALSLRCLGTEPTHVTLHPARPLRSNKGYVWVRLAIYDDIDDSGLDYDDDDDENYVDPSAPFITNKNIEIAADGRTHHYVACYELPHTNDRLQEQAYTYFTKPSVPLIGLIYSQWNSIPVEKIGNESNGPTVYDSGKRYDLFAGEKDGQKELFIFDYATKKWVEGTSIPLHEDCEVVYIAQVLDGVYFTDGGSALRKMVIGTWVPTDVVSIDPQMTAPVGAKILCLHNNRIYLSNFPDDPNLSVCSQIEEDGPHYNEYPYRWYTPNKHAKESSYIPITAVIPYTTNSILIMTRSTGTLFTASDSFESGMPTQLDFFGINFGVAAQGDIINYNGRLLAFNSTEGMRRFNGAEWQPIPNSVDKMFARVSMAHRRKLFGYGRKLFFSYFDEVDQDRRVLVYDMAMNYQQYPWFMDTNLSFIDARADDQYNVLATHEEYLCVEEIYKSDTWSDFDTPICLERHSKYIQIPGLSHDMILRRTFAAMLADTTRSWFIGLSFDDNAVFTNEKSRQNVYVWRKVIFASKKTADNPEDIYKNQDVEYAALKRVIVRTAHSATSVQFRIKTWTFDNQANFVYFLPEVGPRSLL